ncbi:formylglycine-generating enzyme family protein [Candidatus Viridilinea mediisalina]|nr:SUMF1/EgtB/PvdO family nonheme iron enzyme [Candidatus Viridilinea mediisalina]
MTKKEERYTIIGLIIAVLSLLIAIPPIQRFIEERTSAAPTPTALATPTMPPTSAPVVVSPLPPWVPELVKVPAGPFLMGSTDADIRARDNEKPQHELTLPDYWIGHTEVTNAQFRPFVEGDGYTNIAYWTEAGWAWRVAEKISQPMFWEDSLFNGDDQPVVGVSWYEAVAYVRWLSAQIGHTFRLPTEAEWEKAARGPDGRIYPWGDTWDTSRLHSGGTVGRTTTTPVGQYPSGASPYRALDLAGNVWEWCATKWRERYPYRLVDEWTEEYLAGESSRVMCGTSHRGSSELHSRSASRIDRELDPRHGHDLRSYVGLRIASDAPVPGAGQ